jgi:hypothetical protein
MQLVTVFTVNLCFCSYHVCLPSIIFSLHWLPYKVAVAHFGFVFYQPKMVVLVNEAAELGLKTMETKTELCRHYLYV